MNYKLPLLVFMSFSLVLTSCKKDDETPEPAPAGPSGSNNSTANTTPSFPGSDGSLWAVKTTTVQSTPIGPFTIELGTGVAVFTSDSYSTYLPAGAVTLNSTGLTQNSNNTYVLTPSQTNPTGVDFSSGVNWSVSGGASVPGFNYDVSSLPFPSVASITSAATVNRSAGYTLSTTSVINADSVIFAIGGVNKTLAGNNGSCNFTADDLASLSAGASVAQIVGYSYTSQTIGSKLYYFGKESVQTLSVTIQ